MNINSYKYHEDPEIDRKIRALFMYFEEGTKDKSIELKISLCNTWIEEFIKFEEYELANAFTKLRDIFSNP